MSSDPTTDQLKEQSKGEYATPVEPYRGSTLPSSPYAPIQPYQLEPPYITNSERARREATLVIDERRKFRRQLRDYIGVVITYTLIWLGAGMISSGVFTLWPLWPVWPALFLGFVLLNIFLSLRNPPPSLSDAEEEDELNAEARSMEVEQQFIYQEKIARQELGGKSFLAGINRWQEQQDFQRRGRH